MSNQRPCDHNHEWVDREEHGKRKWKDYRRTIESTVVRTYQSEDERLRDFQPLRAGNYFLNPNNPCQILQAVRWRVFYKNARAYVEALYERAPAIKDGDLSPPDELICVIEGIKWLVKGQAQLGRPKKPKQVVIREDLVADVEAAILFCSGRDGDIRRKTIARNLGMSESDLKRRLKALKPPRTFKDIRSRPLKRLN